MVADAGAVDGALTGAPFAAAGKNPEEKISCTRQSSLFKQLAARCGARHDFMSSWMAP